MNISTSDIDNVRDLLSSDAQATVLKIGAVTAVKSDLFKNTIAAIKAGETPLLSREHSATLQRELRQALAAYLVKAEVTKPNAPERARKKGVTLRRNPQMGRHPKVVHVGSTRGRHMTGLVNKAVAFAENEARSKGITLKEVNLNAVKTLSSIMSAALPDPGDVVITHIVRGPGKRSLHQPSMGGAAIDFRYSVKERTENSKIVKGFNALSDYIKRHGLSGVVDELLLEKYSPSGVFSHYIVHIGMSESVSKQLVAKATVVNGKTTINSRGATMPVAFSGSLPVMSDSGGKHEEWVNAIYAETQKSVVPFVKSLTKNQIANVLKHEGFGPKWPYPANHVNDLGFSGPLQMGGDAWTDGSGVRTSQAKLARETRAGRLAADINVAPKVWTKWMERYMTPRGLGKYATGDEFHDFVLLYAVHNLGPGAMSDFLSGKTKRLPAYAWKQSAAAQELHRNHTVKLVAV